METLDLLEKRINSLLDKVTFLSSENNRLQLETEQGLSAFAEENRVLAEENRKLKEALDKELQCKEAVGGRIDALVERLKSQLDES
ncbi:cell division protein ZapB [Desulfovibrio litoralis]|uniref:Cell division protein ZapB n=1 Tax=Desulfovibrio litoralis DSM 11393 TaxID=1121455 RepID=A0A1M7SS38_9BACT|nr:cell division protein ZapB [Desulfovibrio litoralis]SHN61231.1 cell division protein ZapB [Desulfovibrio litoralis DSM 11393]